MSERLRMMKNRHSACSILLLLHPFFSFLSLFKGGEKDLCANLLANILLISDIRLKYT